MAGPSSSFVPPTVSPSRTKRRFTLEQANRSLPLVSRIVRDIVVAHKKITTLQHRAQGPTASKDPAAQRELESTVNRLQSFVDELTNVGVELKDYQTGLVDFTGRHQGRDVYLCWKLGEAKISFWHELHAGFAGRKSVATLDERE